MLENRKINATMGGSSFKIERDVKTLRVLVEDETAGLGLFKKEQAGSDLWSGCPDTTSNSANQLH